MKVKHFFTGELERLEALDFVARHMYATYDSKDLTTWTHEELWKSDEEDEDRERISRKAFEQWQQREEAARKEAEVVARRKAENCSAEKKKRRVKEARRKAEEVVRKGMVLKTGLKHLLRKHSGSICQKRVQPQWKKPSHEEDGRGSGSTGIGQRPVRKYTVRREE
ncbi:hypothetical protein L210DRAFT_933619 [Boletus edulis BED1]|uniref:Uncharacterized protein n=1 Tax=Boletus edulis BED1 TaxID=1328754 RepID=A0AAD4BGH2_BOLED|nr:hypothetical protein L210DRAFT_933619 [Boletus edulis BED1]